MTTLIQQGHLKYFFIQIIYYLKNKYIFSKDTYNLFIIKKLYFFSARTIQTIYFFK